MNYGKINRRVKSNLTKHKFISIIWWNRWWSKLYYNAIDGTTNLVKWFRPIWSDINWGYFYLYKIILFKIGDLKKQISKRNHEGTSKTLDSMSRCEILLTNLIKDDYIDRCGQIKKGMHKHDKIKIIMRSEELRKAEKAELFKLIENNIETWWD